MPHSTRSSDQLPQDVWRVSYVPPLVGQVYAASVVRGACLAWRNNSHAAGDSGFVPAAKVARRPGIDFIVDPMWANISESLPEHIDGLWSRVKASPKNMDDPLYVSKMEVGAATNRTHLSCFVSTKATLPQCAFTQHDYSVSISFCAHFGNVASVCQGLCSVYAPFTHHGCTARWTPGLDTRWRETKSGLAQ